MLRQDKTFRLPKEVKRRLATMNGIDATIYRKSMIQAIILGSIEPPKEKRKGKQMIKVKVEDEE